jgi:maltose alpha-D-glucosyltransferase / alpha-amylase
MGNKGRDALGNDPLWYKQAIIYQLHVRSFCDSNSDGIGDFAGLTTKLDYLQDLGVTAIWVMPFYPSPLKDDGYDIADYYSINPIYGSLRDFKLFLREAHRRGLRVITELVINHTSDQHAWFQRSRRAKPDSVWRDYYVWTKDPNKYKEVRIIFKDYEPSNWTWDPVANAYYWHRFFSHQPDLNFDNPKVHDEILRVIDFWCDMGVDGFRLDAIPYLYEREGSSGESLPETHAFIKKLRAHVDEKYGDRIFLAEANQWPEEAVTYFGGGRGDECHMAFHFPVMPRLFMAVRMEDRTPVVDILEQTPALPETAQWAVFLRNHDELTLEMVTDEERDYMYRVYAHETKARINLGIRRRLAPLLGNDRNKIELLNMLLLSLPGTPVLYYGDEIGMGDNIYLGDRNGVRTPMHWSSDKNAGFSRASPQALQLPIIIDPEYHYESINVEAQQRNPNSLLWWTKRLLALRKTWKAFGSGSIEFISGDNRKVLAFVRRLEAETILVVANLSRFPQPVQLDLAAFDGQAPRELFGRMRFPEITRAPYGLALSPHTAFWFTLKPQETNIATAKRTLPVIDARTDWSDVISGPARDQLTAALPAFLTDQKWFAGRGKDINSISLRDSIVFRDGAQRFYASVFRIDYVQGDPEDYFIPIAFAHRAAADEIRRTHADAIIAEVQGAAHGIVYDATISERFGKIFAEAIARDLKLKGDHGELVCEREPAFRELRGQLTSAAVQRTDHSNTTIRYGDVCFMKIFRRTEPGTHPELEMLRFLHSTGFKHTPSLLGAAEYRRDGETMSFAVATAFVRDSQNAWQHAFDAVGRYFDRVRALAPDAPMPALNGNLFSLAGGTPPDDATSLIGTFVEHARLLGQRTGELHVALATDSGHKDFAPESFTPFYQRSLYQSMRNRAVEVIGALKSSVKNLPEDARELATRVIAQQPLIISRLRAVHEQRIDARRIRLHGDFHLGQVLFTGKDFVLVDFEGAWARPLSERRIKYSPARDVAGMIRSLHYVAHAGLRYQQSIGNFAPAQAQRAEPYARLWYLCTSSIFLRAHIEALDKTDLLPKSSNELAVLLNAHLIDKALAETGAELNARSERLHIPLRGILDLVETNT